MKEAVSNFEKYNSIRIIKHLLLDDVMFEFIKAFKQRQVICHHLDNLTEDEINPTLNKEMLKQLDYCNNRILEILNIKL